MLRILLVPLIWPLRAARLPFATIATLFLIISILEGRGIYFAILGALIALAAQAFCAVTAQMLTNYRMMYLLEAKVRRDSHMFSEFDVANSNILRQDMEMFMKHPVHSLLQLLPKKFQFNPSYTILVGKPGTAADCQDPEAFPKGDGKTVIFFPDEPSERFTTWERFILYHELEHASSWSNVHESDPAMCLIGTIILYLSCIFVSGFDPVLILIGVVAIGFLLLESQYIFPGQLEGRTDLRALARFEPLERKFLLEELHKKYFALLSNKNLKMKKRCEAAQRTIHHRRALLSGLWLSEKRIEVLLKNIETQESSNPVWALGSIAVFAFCLFFVLRQDDAVTLPLSLWMFGLSALALLITTISYSNALDEFSTTENLMGSSFVRGRSDTQV